MVWTPYFEPKKWLKDHPEKKMATSLLTSTELQKQAKQITDIRAQLRRKALELEEKQYALVDQSVVDIWKLAAKIQRGYFKGKVL